MQCYVPTFHEGVLKTFVERRRDSWKNSILTDEADATLCSEALALYVKSLTLLQKSMDLAARYWQRRGGAGVASARLNNAVQWGRERFNETLEKADFVKSKVPTNHRESAVAPEKLIYDRALEMVYVIAFYRANYFRVAVLL